MKTTWSRNLYCLQNVAITSWQVIYMLSTSSCVRVMRIACRTNLRNKCMCPTQVSSLTVVALLMLLRLLLLLLVIVRVIVLQRNDDRSINSTTKQQHVITGSRVKTKHQQDLPNTRLARNEKLKQNTRDNITISRWQAKKIDLPDSRRYKRLLNTQRC